MAKQVSFSKYSCPRCKEVKDKRYFRKLTTNVNGLSDMCGVCERKADRIKLRLERIKREDPERYAKIKAEYGLNRDKIPEEVVKIRKKYKKRKTIKKATRLQRLKKADPSKYIQVMTEQRDKQEDAIISAIVAKDPDGIIARGLVKNPFEMSAIVLHGKIEKYFDTTSLTKRKISDMERANLPPPTLNDLANAIGVRAGDLRRYIQPEYQVGTNAELAVIKKMLVVAVQELAGFGERNLYGSYASGATTHLKAIQPEMFADKDQGGGSGSTNIIIGDTAAALMDILKKKQLDDTIQEAQIVEPEEDES